MSYSQEEVNRILAEKNGELAEYLKKIGQSAEDFKAKYESKINAVQRQLNSLETHYARTGFGPGGGGGGIDTQATRQHKEAFLAWARKGSDPDGLKSLEIQANLSTLSDPDGGYLVPVEIEKNIERLALASVAMRRLARVVTARGEYSKPLSKGGATGGWIGEKDSRPETDTPELNLFSPKMAELYAMPTVTQKLLDLSDFDIVSWLTEEINDVFVSTEGEAFITGDGVGKPKGIIDSTLMVANASWSYGKTGYIASGNATQLNNADKLFDLQHALKPVYRQNGTWLMNDATFAHIRKMKDGEGNYLWRPGLLENAPDILLGKPVAISDNMPDIGASAYPVAFGDWQRAYTIIDHVSGIRMLRDPYTTKGYVAFYTVKRLAAGISNYSAVKFLKVATS